MIGNRISTGIRMLRICSFVLKHPILLGHSCFATANDCNNGGDSGERGEENVVKGDFIQQLFIEKIREYDQKLKENGGKMFDPAPELENERQHLLDILAKTIFKTAPPPSDLTEFPKFDFKDPPLDSIDLPDEHAKKK